MRYTQEFLDQYSLVEKAKEALTAAQRKLQELCPHVGLDGTSTFSDGLSFTDCRICGQSSYYAGGS